MKSEKIHGHRRQEKSCGIFKISEVLVRVMNKDAEVNICFRTFREYHTEYLFDIPRLLH